MKVDLEYKSNFNLVIFITQPKGRQQKKSAVSKLRKYHNHVPVSDCFLIRLSKNQKVELFFMLKSVLCNSQPTVFWRAEASAHLLYLASSPINSGFILYSIILRVMFVLCCCVLSSLESFITEMLHFTHSLIKFCFFLINVYIQSL